MESLRAGAVVPLVLCVIFLASSSGVAGTDSIEDIIPPSLAIPQGNHVQQVLFATGVQIYIYNSTSTAWVLNNVSADLYNCRGSKVGHHFFLAQLDVNGGQATWESFHPVTRVSGKRLAAVSQSDSIAWVLLQATTNVGNTFFGLTTFIQRIFTQHGLPPAAGGSAQGGDIFRSNYTALYVFSKADSSNYSGLSVFSAKN